MSRRLILTTHASAAGHLKMIHRGDRVLWFNHRLVRDVVPSTENLLEFFAMRQSLHTADPAQCGDWDGCMDEDATECFDEIDAHWTDFDSIEFWANPDPNAQLVFLQFLDWFGRRGDAAIEKLYLIQSATALGDRRADDIRSMEVIPQPIERRHLKLARLAWDAFRQPTPEQWAALLQVDLTDLSFLHRTVVRMLEELPSAATGLGSTETRVLASIAHGQTKPLWVMCDVRESDDLPVLDYWEIGKILDQLSLGPESVLLGLNDGPFDDALHSIPERLAHYRSSQLSLSPLGQELLEGTADIAEHGSINRWWGGTRLINDNCWRWNSAEQMLTAPS